MFFKINLFDVQQAQDILNDCPLYKQFASWLTTDLLHMSDEEMSYDLIEVFKMEGIDFTIS